ncbi:unnamed protein product [Pedinophyceae sp. YPF-701]|nr:unnamed protein product [Pedinophyceae sp. YPF-701]
MSTDGLKQAGKYLRWAKERQDVHCDEVAGHVRDFLATQLRPGEFYSTEEAKELLGELEGSLRDAVRQEIRHVQLVAANLARKLVDGAKDAGATVEVDTVGLEDEAAINELKWEEQASSDAPPAVGLPAAASKDPPPRVADPDVSRRVAELTAQLDRARLEETNTREALERARRDAAALREQIEHERQARRAVDNTRPGGLPPLGGALPPVRGAAQGGGEEEGSLVLLERVAKLERTNEELGRKLVAARAEASKARADAEQAEQKVQGANFTAARTAGRAERSAEARVQDSKQFQQLKQLMQKKSQEVIELRKRLQKYEPDIVPTAD